MLMTDSDLPAFARAANLIDRRDAKIVTDALEAEGIPCWSSVDTDTTDAALAFGHGAMGAPSGVVVVVYGHDLERAQGVIARL